MQGLVRYLYGPGDTGEHRDPHIVAGFWTPAELEPALLEDGRRDFRRLDGLLSQPLALLGDRNYRKPVWHLPVRAAPEDPILTDGQWAEIAREIMARTGLAADGDDDAVRWIAVRHADDHIHVVATLARTDGVRPEIWNDGYRVRDACRAVEERYGLRRTAPADRTAARRPKRGENEKAHRYGRDEAPRTILRRHVQTAAAGARTEEGFFTGLKAEGALVRRRYSSHDPSEVTGYAVALADDLNPAGEPVWFGGGNLAADLTLPKLRRRWAPPSTHSSSSRPVSGRHLSGTSARAYLRTVVREAADGSRTADEFLGRLEAAGILVRRRFSHIDPEQLTGYAVALPDQPESDHTALWYGGGRLAPNLTLPRLHQRWNTDPSSTSEADLTSEERQAFYDDAARAASFATAQIRRHTVTDPHAAQDACWAASDLLHVAAKATGNPHLRRAADAYDRAARAPYGRTPQPTPAGNGLRTSARLLAIAGRITTPATAATMVLVTTLITLLETIAQHHATHQRQPQQAATRTAARHLSDLTQAPAGTPTWLSNPAQAPSPMQLAMADFPAPWAPAHTTSTARTTGPKPGTAPRRKPG
ncbi:relaxase/mobilization nuclease domain-containing protein [Actinomadura xylanilytica]|uniref:relaxase/mobilization nuclease domain-containing protein n=1 Tax=Actinomadura xylanilytica TaxID=887459 RepID=UPI00255A7203|nr:hypothetical protein [Actinomadura xylanilytica]MDL4770698.1 hypothetical protein [Actinomadura xylanilytica]